MKQKFAALMALAMTASLLSSCGSEESTGIAAGNDSNPVAVQQEGTAARNWEGAVAIELSDDGITVDGAAASEDHTAAVYIARDIVYYEEGKDFTYGEGTEADAHSKEEADAHIVLHITQPGTYVLRGRLSAGQVAVDLGEDAKEDPNAVVTLILDEVDITCTVAPAVIFYNVYECGSTDEETASETVDTAAAGANVVIADGTTNNINGSYVARIYKPDSVELSEDGTEVVDSKKLHKYDAAFYSKMTMNVDGENGDSGVLNIAAENEGLDSELHLTINGGTINITSGNDGINTNEDGISVTTVNGGNLNIVVSGETGEGDGIDSNGWLVINGGTVTASACGISGDAGIDSDMGISINGGTVMAAGNMLDHIADQQQNYAVFQFSARENGGTSITMKAQDGSVVGEWTPVNDFSYLIVSSPELNSGTYTLWSGEIQLGHSGAQDGMMGGHGGMRPDGMGMPNDRMPPEDFIPGEMPDDRTPPEDFVPGEMPDDRTPPEDFVPGQRPEGMEPPAGFEKGQRPGGDMGNLEKDHQAVQGDFSIQNGENYFQGVGELVSDIEEKA